MITEQIETPTHTRTGSANQEMSRSTERRISLPDENREWPRLGAELTRDGVRYCTWSPEADLVTVEVTPIGGEAARSITLERAKSGYFVGLDDRGRAGDRYLLRVDGQGPFPDPASRSQEESVHGASVVVDPASYVWHDANWSRPTYRDLVIYELHIGTFTPEGTYLAAIEKLGYLKRLGVSAIEIMPIGDFPGERNWGYDGVMIYAPTRAYGEPNDLRALVDAAHQHGIAVILDVVYNHFGPDGNYLGAYSKTFFNEAHPTPWGAGFNFDGENAGAVRRFFADNPIYWMEDFHIDGFRFDATHAIIDTSARHIFLEMTTSIHQRGGYAIAEDSRNDAQLLSAEAAGGQDFDGVWADDFHHVIRVGQTGQKEAYFKDFKGTLDELIDTLRNGWLYRGQFSASSEENRGTECHELPPSKFVHCISNHDQTGNRAMGDRLNHVISPEAYRAASMLLCLSPYTPMLFMGQEWSASTPFLYFTEHNDQLGPLITEGRRREFAEFPGFDNPETLTRIPDPQSEGTFLQSKLDWAEVEKQPHAGMMALYAECIRLRNSDPHFRPDGRDTWEADRLECHVGAIRFGYDEGKYLLLFDMAGGNSGSLRTERLASLPEGEQWELVLSTEEARFGGNDRPPFVAAEQSCRFTRPGCALLRSVSTRTTLVPGAKLFPEASSEGPASRISLA